MHRATARVALVWSAPDPLPSRLIHQSPVPHWLPPLDKWRHRPVDHLLDGLMARRHAERGNSASCWPIPRHEANTLALLPPAR